MENTGKVRQLGKIDKSALTFGTEQRIEDDRYRKSGQGRLCEACGGASGCDPESVVGAHPRAMQAGGMRLKPSDDLMVFLCFACHSIQETAGAGWLARFTIEKMLRLPWAEDDPPTEAESRWILLHIFRPLRRKLYQKWKATR